MLKHLEDGTNAIGLCHRGEVSTSITAWWSDLGVTGRQTLRDVWRHRDLGDFTDDFTATVQRHGVTLLRVRPAAR